MSHTASSFWVGAGAVPGGGRLAGSAAFAVSPWMTGGGAGGVSFLVHEARTSASAHSLVMAAPYLTSCETRVTSRANAWPHKHRARTTVVRAASDAHTASAAGWAGPRVSIFR